jgi:hypothetical protein
MELPKAWRHVLPHSDEISASGMLFMQGDSHILQNAAPHSVMSDLISEFIINFSRSFLICTCVIKLSDNTI